MIDTQKILTEAINLSNWMSGEVVLVEDTTINVSSKIDAILAEVPAEKLPAKRKDLIKDIMGEFARSKEDIIKLKGIITKKLADGDKKLTDAYKKAQELDPEILEMLGIASNKLHTILDSNKTGTPALKNFVSEFIVDVAGFSDEDLRTAMKIENEIANALK